MSSSFKHSLSSRLKIGPTHKRKIVSTETRKKLSIAQKRNWESKEYRQNQVMMALERWRDAVYRNKQIGQKRSKETRRNISLAKLGKKCMPFSETHKQKIRLAKLGKKRASFSKKWKRNMSLALKGRVQSEETRRKISIGLRGEKHYRFKGGITNLRSAIRGLFEYREWRKTVFKHDDYICQECNQRGKYLEAHHYPKSFTELLTDFLREYSQFSPIEEKEILLRLAMNYKPFWDLNNGKTLCLSCHNKIKQGRSKIIKNVEN